MSSSCDDPRIKVSVIVPVYNGQKTLGACLDSLMQLDFLKEEREILIVDNHSTDDTKEMILRYPVTYLFEPNKGRGWARNRGVKNARGEFVAFIDADCIAPKDWLKVLTQGIEKDDDIAVCGGQILSFKNETIFEQYYDRSWFLSQEVGIRGKFEHDLPRVVTANGIFRKSIFEEVGYFDEDLVTCEDTEISWRISLAGYEIKLLPEAEVYHQHIDTFWSFCRHFYEYGVADRIMIQKYRNFYSTVDSSTYWQRPLRYLLHDVVGIILFEVDSLVTEVRNKASFSFIFVMLIVKISRLAGWVTTAIRETFLADEPKQRQKVPLKNFFERKFTFRDNGSLWSLVPAATWFLNDDSIKMVVYEDFTTYKFNKVGTQIWRSLLRTKDLKITIEEISSSYRVPEDALKNDIDDFLNYLKGEGILEKNRIEAAKADL